MIRKSGHRFSEKIMRKQESRARWRFILIPSRSSATGARDKGADAHEPFRTSRLHASIPIEAFTASFARHRIIDAPRGRNDVPPSIIQGVIVMGRYAVDNKTVSEAVNGGGLLVVAQWEAREGEADKVAAILDRFLPEAQREEGAKLFLISRAKENPAQFLFYELFRDEAAFKAHQESAHFKTYIAGEALPLLAKRERAQYALL
jgi:quinol monooxygenase YgiN